MAAKLTLSRLSFKGARVRTKTKIAPTDAGGFAGEGGLNDSAAVTICAVEPVVQTIIKTIGAMLLIAFGKAAKEGLMNISRAVAICVFRIEYFRGGADDDSFAPGNDSIGEI